MQLGILQISLTHLQFAAILQKWGHLYILVAVHSKWLFRTHVQCPVLNSFQLEKSNPKRQMIPQWQVDETGFLSQTPRNVTSDTNYEVII